MTLVIRDPERIRTILNRTRETKYSSEVRTYSSEEISDRFMDPNFLFYSNREGNRTKFLREEKRMGGQYLGACLDYVRDGAMNACFWELGGARGLAKFIQEWMSLNKKNLIWSDEKIPKKLELPYIKHDKCPRDKEHLGKITDSAGLIRCNHTLKAEVKPSYIVEHIYFDDLSQTKKRDISTDSPEEPYIDEEFDYDKRGILVKHKQKQIEEYDEEMRRFNAEDSVQFKDICYAVMSDQRLIMPLEKVLRRLNITSETETTHCPDVLNCRVEDNPSCFGHQTPSKWVGFPFCGWTLAWYVQKWYEQTPDGKAPMFMRKDERDTFRLWPNFRVITSED